MRAEIYLYNHSFGYREIELRDMVVFGAFPLQIADKIVDSQRFVDDLLGIMEAADLIVGDFVDSPKK